MTKDEAIQLFKEMESKETYWQLQELCDLAIEALSADAPTIEPSGDTSTKNTNTSTNTSTDLISRADAIDKLRKERNREDENIIPYEDSDIGVLVGLDKAIRIVQDVPSVSAERVALQSEEYPLRLTEETAIELLKLTGRRWG